MITFTTFTNNQPEQEEMRQGRTYIFTGELSVTQGLKARDFSDRFLIAIEPVELNGKLCIGVDSEGFLWYKTDDMVYQEVNITAAISN
jgi:hypothetical protein